jgi:hypothetical protein
MNGPAPRGPHRSCPLCAALRQSDLRGRTKVDSQLYRERNGRSTMWEIVECRRLNFGLTRGPFIHECKLCEVQKRPDEGMRIRRGMEG